MGLVTSRVFYVCNLRIDVMMSLVNTSLDKGREKLLDRNSVSACYSVLKNAKFHPLLIQVNPRLTLG